MGGDQEAVGTGMILFAAALGFAVGPGATHPGVPGAVATPWATAVLSESAWIASLLASAAVALLLFGLPFSAAPFPVAAFVLGFVSQAVKFPVDTLVQRHVDDAYRGRGRSVSTSRPAALSTRPAPAPSASVSRSAPSPRA